MHCFRPRPPSRFVPRCTLLTCADASYRSDRAALTGLGWGLLAAAIWAVYSVLARLGVTAGLSPADMSLLRFAPGALLTLPLMWRWGWRDLAGIGWGRGLILTLLAGPGFACCS